MKAHTAHKPDRPRAAAAKPGGLQATAATRDGAFWRQLDGYNRLDARTRVESLLPLGLGTKDEEALRVLAKSHFVIPGKTRFTCKGCGECCRYIYRVTTFSYRPCEHLTPQNRCSIYPRRFQICHTFPFWILRDPNLGKLLTIKPYCHGYGQGALLDYDRIVSSLEQHEREIAGHRDEVQIVHELLLMPDTGEWSLPSPDNFSKLWRYAREQAGLAVPPPKP